MQNSRVFNFVIKIKNPTNNKFMAYSKSYNIHPKIKNWYIKYAVIWFKSERNVYLIVCRYF